MEKETPLKETLSEETEGEKTYRIERPDKEGKHKVTIFRGKEKIDTFSFVYKFWMKEKQFEKFLEFLKDYKEFNKDERKKLRLKIEEDFIKYKSKDTTPKREKAEITKEELKILKDPNIFTLITENELDKTITGEKQSRKAIFLSLCSVWIKDIKVPLDTLVSSESSAGKSYVCKQTIKLFPEHMVVYRSKISGEAFTYWHVNEDDWTWDGKILSLEDISQSVLDSPTFRVMCSDGSIATVVKNQEAIDLIVNGKPCMLITTASTNPSKEVLNRFNIISLDESKEQTETITLNESKETKNIEFDPIFPSALNHLETRKVTVPFAEKIHIYITNNYGWGDIRMRRDFSRFRDLIKCSTVLHQFQREKDDKNKLIATKQDYEIAKECINYIQIYTLKGLVHKLKRSYECCLKEGTFTAKEIHAAHPIVSLQTWYKYLDELCERRLLKTELLETEKSDRKVTHYSIAGIGDLTLPNFEELELKELNLLNHKGLPGKKIKSESPKNPETTKNDQKSQLHSQKNNFEFHDSSLKGLKGLIAIRLRKTENPIFHKCSNCDSTNVKGWDYEDEKGNVYCDVCVVKPETLPENPKVEVENVE